MLLANGMVLMVLMVLPCSVVELADPGPISWWMVYCGNRAICFIGFQLVQQRGYKLIEQERNRGKVLIKLRLMYIIMRDLIFWVLRGINL